MATLDSTTSTADVRAAFDDNSGYEASNSLSMAQTFLQACIILSNRVPKRSVSGGRGAEEFEIAPEILENRLREVRTWRSSKTATSRVRHVDLGVDFRG